MHVVLDAVITAVSYLIAWYLILGRSTTPGRALPLEVYASALIIIIPVYLLLYAAFNLYSPKRVQSRRYELANICRANIVGLMIFTFVLFGGRNFRSLGPYLDNFSARMIIAPGELPVGILTAVMGGPVFIWMLLPSAAMVAPAPPSSIQSAVTFQP